MYYITTAHQAELNAAERMRELGFVDAHAVPPGPDGGIDVISTRALAQVKWKGAVVGRPHLQQLYGARAADMDKQLLFFAASGYSTHAVEFADSTGIHLFTYDPTGAIEPANESARTVLLAAQRQPAPTQIAEQRQGAIKDRIAYLDHLIRFSAPTFLVSMVLFLLVALAAPTYAPIVKVLVLVLLGVGGLSLAVLIWAAGSKSSLRR